MSKINLLIIAVVSLIIINVCLLGYLFFYRPKNSLAQPPLNNDQPKNIIIKKLNFNNQQIAAYQDLINEHRQNVMDYNHLIRETKTELYLTLSESNPAKATELQNKLAQLQKEIEIVHYNHFAAIKKLCKPNQIAAFNELTTELAAIFNNDKGRPQHLPPPPRPF